MARFLADEDFDHRIAARLRILGHDVLTLAVLASVAAQGQDRSPFFFSPSNRLAIRTQ